MLSPNEASIAEPGPGKQDLLLLRPKSCRSLPASNWPFSLSRYKPVASPVESCWSFQELQEYSTYTYRYCTGRRGGGTVPTGRHKPGRAGTCTRRSRIPPVPTVLDHFAEFAESFEERARYHAYGTSQQSYKMLIQKNSDMCR